MLGIDIDLSGIPNLSNVKGITLNTYFCGVSAYSAFGTSAVQLFSRGMTQDAPSTLEQE